MRARAGLCAGAALLLAACGSPTEPKVDVAVSIEGAQRICKVALSQEAQPSSVACADLVPFLRDELRLASGAVFALRSDGAVDPSLVATVTANLEGAGYRSAR